MNCKPWLVDEGQVPTRVVLERATGETVLQWSAKDPELEAEIEAGILMQEQELAKGCHNYRIVVYDANGKQLAEMPKPLRGKSVDATVAGTESLALQRSVQAALNNMGFVVQAERDQVEQVLKALGDSREDVGILLDKFNLSRSENYSQQLELLAFERKQARWDMITQAASPAVGMMLERLVKKFAPDIEKLLEGVVKATAAGSVPNVATQSQQAPAGGSVPNATTQNQQLGDSSLLADIGPASPANNEDSGRRPARSGRSSNHRHRAAHPSASPTK
jgi:uncharacterized protein (DUF697 family)